MEPRAWDESQAEDVLMDLSEGPGVAVGAPPDIVATKEAELASAASPSGR